MVVVLIRVVRLALLLVLAAIAVTLVIAAFRPETGGLETAMLIALVGVCLIAGAGITSISLRLKNHPAK